MQTQAQETRTPVTLSDVLAAYFNPRARSMPSSTQAVIARLESGGEVTEWCPRCEGKGRKACGKASCMRCLGKGSVQSKAPCEASQSRQCPACAGKSPAAHSKAWQSQYTPGLGASPGCRACGYRGYVTGIDAQPIHGQAEEPSCEMQVDAGWRVMRWLRGLPYVERLAVEVYFAPRAVAWREGGGDSLAPLLPLTRLGQEAKTAAEADLPWAGELLELSLQEARRIQLKVFSNVKKLRGPGRDGAEETENSCNAT